MTSRVNLARIHDAAPDVSLHACSRASELLAIVRNAPVDLVIVEPYDADGSPLAPVVSRLRAAAPRLAIVAYARLASRDARELIPLARAGVSECIFSDTDDDRMALRRIITKAESTQLRTLVSRQVAAFLPPPVARAIDDCLALPLRQATVSSLASSLGVHRRTLVNRMAASGCLHPGAMLSWSRLLVAGRLLEDSWRNVDAIAAEVGFADATSLRAVLRRYAGLRPSEIRSGDGLLLVISRLRQVFIGRSDTPVVVA